jgi:predicted alpha-1,2-mannosidase
VGDRVGYHRYTFPGGLAPGDAVILVDLARTLPGGEVLGGSVQVLPAERRLRGRSHVDGALGGAYSVYLDAEFDREIVAHGVFADGVFMAGDATADGTVVGAWVAFDTSSDATVEVQVGVSYTGPEGAQLNREAEAVDDFAAARARARQVWEDHLGQIVVEGGTAREQRMLHTALYHVLQHPTASSDADLAYAGFDGQVHSDGRRFYTDFSLWDTYRVENPLLILLRPEASADMAQSLVRMAEQSGGLPRWPLATSDSGSMIGTSADVVLAETYLKGVTDFDVQAAYGFMTAHATGPVAVGGRSGIEEYLSLGYVAADVTSGSVSKTQEYAWDDFALSNLAAALGEEADAAQFAQQSRTITRVFDPGLGFFRGRNADGSWVPEIVLDYWLDFYVEGDAWQYVWLTPHPDLLVELLGGRDAVVTRLDELFTQAKDYWENSGLGTWAPNPYYWQGNEVDLHAPYLYAALGRPAGTQKWVRWIMSQFYGLGPKGLPGNDDCGTMSAWYVFSALGFYPLAGSDLYFIGTPAFSLATVRLPGGDLVIEAEGRDRGDYVQSVALDGAPLEVPWFHHGDIVDGATLHFVLGAEPSSWGEAL